MQKKLLFLAPDYYGFNDVIYRGFCDYTDYQCFMVVTATTKRYEYRNVRERLENFFSKTFLNKNLKKAKMQEHVLRQINYEDSYDVIIINRPDILDENLWNLVNRKGGKKIAIFWDSFAKIKGQEETLKHFDVKYSFDKYDCIKYNLQKINNFYFNEGSSLKKTECTVIYLGTYDQRFNDLLKIVENFNKNKISNLSFIYHPSEFEIPISLSKNVSRLENIIPFNESSSINDKGSVYLDIAHENQIGLSFRPFDAIGNRKKLVTTNKNVKNYDFYNENNIFVIEDIDNINIPISFFETPVMELSNEIHDKYSLKSWVKTILN